MWRIEYDPTAEVLGLRLRGHVSAGELMDVAQAQSEALSATAGRAFRVFVDARGLFPLEPEAVATLQSIKRVAAELDGCRAIVVLTDSPTVAMQQRRTRGTDGGQKPETVTLDPGEARGALLPTVS